MLSKVIKIDIEVFDSSFDISFIIYLDYILDDATFELSVDHRIYLILVLFNINFAFVICVFDVPSELGFVNCFGDVLSL